MYVGSSNGRVVLVMQPGMANFEAGLSTILQNAIYHICPNFTFCRAIEGTIFGVVVEPNICIILLLEFSFPLLLLLLLPFLTYFHLEEHFFSSMLQNKPWVYKNSRNYLVTMIWWFENKSKFSN